MALDSRKKSLAARAARRAERAGKRGRFKLSDAYLRYMALGQLRDLKLASMHAEYLRTGVAPVKGRIERIWLETRLERKIYHLAVRRLGPSVLARLRDKASQNAGFFDAVALLEGAPLLRFSGRESVVLHDASTKHLEVLASLIVDAEPVRRLVDERFGGDPQRLAKRMREGLAFGDLLKRVVASAGFKTPTLLVGCTKQAKYAGDFQVRCVKWCTRTAAGRKYMAEVGGPLATAIYDALALVLPGEVAAALADLEKRVSPASRPLGKRAPLTLEIAFGVEVLMHFDENNADGHPSA